jgi:hypothetical protein
MEHAKALITTDTLANWINTRNVPQPGPKDGILKVFFPEAQEGKGDTADDKDWIEFETAWRRAWYTIRPKAKLPPEPVEPASKWVHVGGYEFEGLIEFRLHPLEPGNQDRHLVRATLWIGTARRPWRNCIVTISLVDASVSVLSTSYQPAEGKMIGDKDLSHPNFERMAGGARIVGPLIDGRLTGNILDGGYMAEVEPGVAGGDPLTVRVLADQASFDITALEIRNQESMPKDVGRNKHSVIKALIFDVSEKDSLGRAILAERKMERKFDK